MDATIPIPFALGQELWWVGNGYREEWITCPECAGTRAITMVLGNGESVSLTCAACCEPYGVRLGLVKRVFFEHVPTPFIPRRVSVDGNEVRYSDSEPDANAYRTVEAKALFLFPSACQDACKKLNMERTKHEEQRAVAILASKRKEMAYSVTYWRQRVASMERDLEAARQRLAVAKEKAKDKPEGGAG